MEQESNTIEYKLEFTENLSLIEQLGFVATRILLNQLRAILKLTFQDTLYSSKQKYYISKGFKV